MLSPVVASLADPALVRLLFFDLSFNMILLILGLAVLAPVATTMQEWMMREFALVVPAEFRDTVALGGSVIHAQTEEAGRQNHTEAELVAAGRRRNTKKTKPTRLQCL